MNALTVNFVSNFVCLYTRVFVCVQCSWRFSQGQQQCRELPQSWLISWLCWVAGCLATLHTQWPALMRTDAICQQYVYLWARYPQCPLSMQKQSSVICRQQAYEWSVTLLQKCSPTVKDVVYWYQFSNFRVVFSSACFVKAGIYRFKTDFFST